VSRPECHAGAIRFVIETAQPNNFDQFRCDLWTISSIGKALQNSYNGSASLQRSCFDL